MQSETRLNEYRTVFEESQAEHEVSRSRFIGRCYPVANENQAVSILEQVRKENWDARHHCFAYRIGASAAVARYSDDGEPSGTAGLPMMHVLQQQQLTHVLCVVTRYFGGILLGTGGLVRAYTKACQDSVAHAGVAVVTPCDWYRLAVAYPLWNTLQPFLTARVLMDDVTYTDVVTCVFHIQSRNVDSFLSELRQRTDARVAPQWERKDYASFRVTEVAQ